MIKDDYTGPLDAVPWPEKLKSRVTSSDSERRIHGYAVESDLAQNYSFAETVLLALTGELPSAEQARAFDVALNFLAPITVAEAPAHAALIARICVGTTSSLTGTSAIGLAEQSRFDLTRYQEFVAWLAAPSENAPAKFMATSHRDRLRVSALRLALRTRKCVAPKHLALDLDENAAIIAVLFECGLRSLPQIEVVRTFARLPLVMAEALAAPPAGHKDYPLMLPMIRYEETVSSS